MPICRRCEHGGRAHNWVAPACSWCGNRSPHCPFCFANNQRGRKRGQCQHPGMCVPFVFAADRQAAAGQHVRLTVAVPKAPIIQKARREDRAGRGTKWTISCRAPLNGPSLPLHQNHLGIAFSEFVNHARLLFLISLSRSDIIGRRCGVPSCGEKADWHAPIAD